MEITTYKGHTIRLARPTGGKAGKGNNLTSTLQVFREGGHQILKAIRFNVADAESRKAAARKARAFVDSVTT